MAAQLQHLFPNMSLEVLTLPSQVVTASPLFALPREVRLRIYELVFSYPASSEIPFLGSQQLAPLSTCRQIYQEAKQLAFSWTVHHIDCTWNANIQRQLLVLHPDTVSSIRHLRVSTTADRFYERMQPLRFHIDHVRQPLLTLSTLTIVLDVPNLEDHQHEMDIMRRVQQQDMLLDAIWFYKNTDRVIVDNLTFRKRLSSKVSGVWTCLDEDDEAYIADELLWRLEISDFENYNVIPLVANGVSGLETALVPSSLVQTA